MVFTSEDVGHPHGTPGSFPDAATLVEAPTLHREILDINAAADYLGVSRSHLSHLLAGKVPGVPPIPHVRAGRRALIRRAVIDRWLSEQEHSVAMAGAAQ